jgi:hypothetical protein
MSPGFGPDPEHGSPRSKWCFAENVRLHLFTEVVLAPVAHMSLDDKIIIPKGLRDNVFSRQEWAR